MASTLRQRGYVYNWALWSLNGRQTSFLETTVLGCESKDASNLYLVEVRWSIEG